VTLELDQGAKRQLQGIIKEKLSKISSYTDDVLPEYVLVMVGNGKTEGQVAEDLEAFLGKDNAKDFSRWLWETLQSPNFGQNKHSIHATPNPEETLTHRLSSQIVPLNRDDDIIGNILGDDRDDFNDTYEKDRDNERERPRDKGRERARSRERERQHEGTRNRGNAAREDRRSHANDNRSRENTERHYDRRDREREKDNERETEARRPRDATKLHPEPGMRENSDFGQPKEERKQRLRNSGVHLPARLIMSAVEQAAASTKQRPSHTQLTDTEAMRHENMEEAEGNSHDQTSRKHGLPKVTQQTAQAQKRAKRGNVEFPADVKEDTNPFGLTPGETDGVPTFADDSPVQEDSSFPKHKRCTFWPQCAKGDSCPFYHPTENCKFVIADITC